MSEFITKHIQQEVLTFEPSSEYIFDSVVGKMALFTDNCADDPTLHIFSVLAANIKPTDLCEDLKGILRKYPELVKRMALDHFLIT